LHISAVTTADTGTSSPLILHATGFGRYSGSPPITLSFLAANSTLHNMGKVPILNAWTVRNNMLVTANRMSDHNTNIWGDVVEGIVDLQAEYGLDTDNDTVADTWQATDPTDWAQLRLIRFGLLIRGPDRETSPVTTTAPAWTGGSFTMRNVDGTTDTGAAGPAANNWRYYRYQVQDVVVPLRNMIWRN
jgi:type IV pilus assembly protein PilW